MKSSQILSSLSGLLTIIVLTFGVFAGVTLVGTQQDIRNKAEELREHKVAICHKTGSDSNPWVQIEISDNAVNAHLEHGDIQGNCPKKKEDKEDDKNDKDKEEKRESDSGTGGTGLTTTNVTVVNQTVSPAELKVETKYVYITTRFDFRIKFQGIDQKRPDKIVRVIFRKGEEELHVYNKVMVTSDSKGIYRGTITDIRPGIYEVLVKSDGFLQEKHDNISIVRGLNNFDWSKQVLLAGDFNSDNVLKAEDVAEFLSFYKEKINPINDEIKVFDINMDNFLNLDDINLVIGNFEGLEREGDS